MKSLEVLINTQKQSIDRLGLKITQTLTVPAKSGMSFEQWAGVLLGAVAVIVTVLGVGIAIFSFFGYQEIMRRSKELASEMAKEITPGAVKSEITERMENGSFDDTIEVAIQTIAFRGIEAEQEYDAEPVAESNVGEENS